MASLSPVTDYISHAASQIYAFIYCDMQMKRVFAQPGVAQGRSVLAGV